MLSALVIAALGLILLMCVLPVTVLMELAAAEMMVLVVLLAPSSVAPCFRNQFCIGCLPRTKISLDV